MHSPPLFLFASIKHPQRRVILQRIPRHLFARIFNLQAVRPLGLRKAGLPCLLYYAGESFFF